jgi:hypothetical protein
VVVVKVSPVSAVLVNVEVVPHEHNGCAELLMRGDEQVAVGLLHDERDAMPVLQAPRPGLSAPDPLRRLQVLDGAHGAGEHRDAGRGFRH